MRRQLILVGLLAAGFAAFSVMVGLGALDALDARTSIFFAGLWREQLRPVFLAIALLGGTEAGLLVVMGLAAWLWRHGFAREAWVALALPLAVAVEVAYKHLVSHPPPESRFKHGDAPSLTDLLPDAAGGNSFPSGHMLRTTLVYGLVAFVAGRLSARPRTRTLVTVVTAAVCLLMAVDRLYLGVHWLSDVVGGLLLGALFLSLSVLWLDRGVAAR